MQLLLLFLLLVLLFAAKNATLINFPLETKGLGSPLLSHLPSAGRVPLVAEPLPLPPQVCGSRIPETLHHIWVSREPLGPACKPMSHFCLQGKTNQSRKKIQTPMGVPSCWLLT